MQRIQNLLEEDKVVLPILPFNSYSRYIYIFYQSRCQNLYQSSRLDYFQHAHFIPLVGVGKVRRITVGPWRREGSTRYWNYVEEFWLLCRRALGSERHRYETDPMAYGGINKWTPPQKSGGIPRVSTTFSLSVENEQAEAGWDGQTRFARPNSEARTGTGKYSCYLFS